MGRRAAPGPDHRPRIRLADAAGRGAAGLRGRAGSRAVRPEHAGWRGPGPGRAARGGRRWRLDAAVRRTPGGHRRGRHPAWAARRDPLRPGRPRPGDPAGAGTRVAYQPGLGGSRRGERGDRRRAARAAGRAGPPGGLAARTRRHGPGPAVGGPVVQYPGQRHGGDRHAARRYHPVRPGTAAHPVHAPGQDPRHRVAERAGRLGQRGGPGGAQPAQYRGGYPRPGYGPGRGGPLDDDQARRCPAVLPRAAPPAPGHDRTHRLGPDPRPGPPARSRGRRAGPAHAAGSAAAARGRPAAAPRPGQRGRDHAGRHRARRGAARARAPRGGRGGRA